MRIRRKNKSRAIVSSEVTDEIREKFATTRGQSKLVKFAAARLGLTEGELIATHVGEHQYDLKAIPLVAEWREILGALEACGSLMALTRNETTVSEQTGVYANVNESQGALFIQGENISLQINPQNWYAGFFVSEPPNGPDKPAMESLQFFNKHGRAVHKVYVSGSTNLEEFKAVVRRFNDPDKVYGFESAYAFAGTSASQDKESAVSPAESVERDALVHAWRSVESAHALDDFLHHVNLRRIKALELMQGRYAWKVSANAVSQVLASSAVGEVALQIRVENEGSVQSYSGTVSRLESLEMAEAQWISVLDPAFHLYLRTDLIGSVWRTEWPTSGGILALIEAFGKDGELMISVGGDHREGERDPLEWRTLVNKLPLHH